MKADGHIHTSFSADSETPVTSQINRAIELGMTELCITDHHDYDTSFCDMDFTLDFDTYFSTLERIQAEYRDKIQVNIGIELGLQVHVKDVLDSIASRYPFDFIIGSSHYVDRQDPYYPSFFEGRTEREAYERYLAVTLERVRKLDCFDVCGHLDYVIRRGPTRKFSYSEYRELIDPILKTLIENGKGLECNTGGFRCGLGQPNPAADVLSRYRELGGEILTVGSDAHVPEHLGGDFDRAEVLLKQCGFRYYTVFHQRKPQFLPL